MGLDELAQGRGRAGAHRLPCRRGEGIGAPLELVTEAPAFVGQPTGPGEPLGLEAGPTGGDTAVTRVGI